MDEVLDTRPLVDRHELVRRTHQRLVLDTVFRRGSLSRVQIAQLTGLSKPTVNTVVRQLEEAGLLRQDGMVRGSVGRSPLLYTFNQRAALTVGVDLGGTKVRVAVADLYGEIIAEQMESTASEGGLSVVFQIDELARAIVQRAGLDWSLVRTLGLSAPGVFDPLTDHVDLAFNLPGFGELRLTRELARRLGMDVVVDNDVNLAALGEQRQGLARNCDNFAFIAIGTGIGMGLIVDGTLVRGARGAAGEICYLPMGRDVFSMPGVRRRGAFEEAAAASGIVTRLGAELGRGTPSGLSPQASVAEIFAAAAAGDTAAARVVDGEARLIAEAILAVSAVVDPELFVLGGGVGANPLLLDPVRRYVDEIAPFPIRVETSALGERASLLGAVAFALEKTVTELFEEEQDDG